ncbi:hypothetical protein GCM10023221_30550 [Luteimicrobium xylanilyticum]|uniref:Uncharacterized protein n=1 Tax=Luteimicrobium xylanilyticum TaxID=1133546 RepID=A0A5P9Q5L0_9MICO|nr:hypothetical protein KDY119_00137 [Luteimicrobium xylanilyticum]
MGQRDVASPGFLAKELEHPTLGTLFVEATQLQDERRAARPAARGLTLPPEVLRGARQPRRRRMSSRKPRVPPTDTSRECLMWA